MAHVAVFIQSNGQ